MTNARTTTINGDATTKTADDFPQRPRGRVTFGKLQGVSGRNVSERGDCKAADIFVDGKWVGELTSDVCDFGCTTQEFRVTSYAVEIETGPGDDDVSIMHEVRTINDSRDGLPVREALKAARDFARDFCAPVMRSRKAS